MFFSEINPPSITRPGRTSASPLRAIGFRPAVRGGSRRTRRSRKAIPREFGDFPGQFGPVAQQDDPGPVTPGKPAAVPEVQQEVEGAHSSGPVAGDPERDGPLDYLELSPGHPRDRESVGGRSDRRLLDPRAGRRIDREPEAPGDPGRGPGQFGS